MVVTSDATLCTRRWGRTFGLRESSWKSTKKKGISCLQRWRACGWALSPEISRPLCLCLCLSVCLIHFLRRSFVRYCDIVLLTILESLVFFSSLSLLPCPCPTLLFLSLELGLAKADTSPPLAGVGAGAGELLLTYPKSKTQNKTKQNKSLLAIPFR